MTQNKVNSFMNTFAQEGFLSPDTSQGAGVPAVVAGIRHKTLEDYGVAAGVDETLRPEDLTNTQRIGVYQAIYDEAFQDGGDQEGLFSIDDNYTRNYLSDMMIRAGWPDLVEITQKAVNKVGLDDIAEDKKFGEMTVKAVNNLIENPGKLSQFLDLVAASIEEIHPGENRLPDQ